MTTTEKLKTETVDLLPVGQCHKSPTQPRKRHEKKLDTDFVASIREKGVLQPIVVRVRAAGGWEIVFGHRRHEGSVLAERETIPAIVREMSDEDVFEAQLIENVHREDMHPLDEADGFKRMIDRGRSVQQIAEKIGRPAPYVAQRLKLCELSKEVRAALDKDEISLGVAVLLARVPGSLQAEALEEVNDHWGEGQVSVADAKKTLEAQYLLRLDQAPFDITSADLVAKAGACTACPKRSGQQRELFPDAARADLCIDRVCYRGKLDALWQIRVKEAKTGGPQVLEGKAAEQALGYSGGYRKLTDTEWLDNGKSKTVGDLLGKELPPITLARDHTGAIFELVKRADVDKALKRKSPAGAVSSHSDDQRAQAAKDRIRAAAVDLTIAAAVSRVDRIKDPELIRLLVQVLAKRAWNEVQMAIIKRRGLNAEKNGKPRAGYVNAEEKLLRHFRTLKKAEEVAGLGIEIVLRGSAPSSYSSGGSGWTETLKSLGLEYGVFQRQVAADAKVKKTKGKTKAKPAAKKAA